MKGGSAIVIGSGIVGCAVARALAEQNFSVKVIERHSQCLGASIRNFGMVWPIGQPLGKLYERALRSCELWKQAASEGGFRIHNAGSALAVYHQDEMDVVNEFMEKEVNHRIGLKWVDGRSDFFSPVTNRSGLLGWLHSTTEHIVDPRLAIASLPAWLQRKYEVEFFFGKAATGIAHPKVFVGNDVYEADLIFVCSGADFETLYPEVFAMSGITKCKLQMMRTVPQPVPLATGPALYAGLTLTHYGAFAGLSSLAVLRKRYEQQWPDQMRWGIHVMISENTDGEVTIGDSHEYGPDHHPFDRSDINTLILDYLHTFCRLPNMQLSQSWHGVYAKLPGATEFVCSPVSGVHIVNALSGAGMTLSFGLAEEVVAAVCS